MRNRHKSVLLTGMMTLVLSSGCSVFNKDRDVAGGFFGRSQTAEEQDRQDELANAALDPLGVRDGDRLLLEDLAPDQLFSTFKARSGGRSKEQAQSQYNSAVAIYDRAVAAKNADPTGTSWQPLFVDAANQFRIAGSLWKDSAIEEQAIFFEGESYFFADRYVQSNRAFEKLIAEYTGSNYLDRAERLRYAIAKYWLELSDSGSAVAISDPKRPKFGLAAEARRVLHNIRLDDPTGKLADDATFELGNAFLKKNSYYEAADTYEDLRLNYPRSKYVFDSLMLELESRLKSYQGPSYDATPLDKAEELIKLATRQFPTEAQENREVLEQQSSLIYNQLAQREYEVGKFYQRRGENRAAQQCFQRVAQVYPNSVFAATINEDIEVVAAGPPVPHQHAKWLIDLFPDPQADKPIIASRNGENALR